MNSKKIFLIVDDDSDDRDYIFEAIHDIDHTNKCLFAVNGADAFKKLKKNSHELPDLIFLDLNMPKMNGMEFLQEIKQDNELKNIPVVIFTTSSKEEFKHQTTALGAEHFITKPADYNELVSELKKVI